MKQTKLYAMVSAAMLAALTCITTLVLVIPIPFSMGGYINLGIVLFCWAVGYWGPSMAPPRGPLAPYWQIYLPVI